MRRRFESQLEQLNEEMIDMGSLCEEAIQCIAETIYSGDMTNLERVCRLEKDIDKQEREIENVCLKLLLEQQPVARDFRQISATLKMITDLERIGDQCEDIAGIVHLLEGRHHVLYDKIGSMANSTSKMVTDAIDAFVKRDVEKATSVQNEDDVIDRQFTEIRDALITEIHESPESADVALDVLMIAKYFERIGDHAQNIGEWVVYSLTGEHVSQDD